MKPVCIYTILCLFSCLSFRLTAQNLVSGTISTNTFWTASKWPIHRCGRCYGGSLDYPNHGSWFGIAI